MNELRSEVQVFAEEMEKVLAANDHKPGWKLKGVAYLLGCLLAEVAELKEALSHFTEEEVLRETIDVANFAMMIADVCGLLKSRATHGEV